MLFNIYHQAVMRVAERERVRSGVEAGVEVGIVITDLYSIQIMIN